ncbi:hypothetical protein [Aestuariivirga sp.]|uniref:hypothetical protein n=1 Tax=Aestuariivirga sp. TaxID=2650926 RepID=UPI003BAC0B60
MKREGTATDFLLKDHLASNRLSIRMGGATTKADYAPYGQPLTTNGSSILTGKACFLVSEDPHDCLESGAQIELLEGHRVSAVLRVDGLPCSS